MDVTPLLGELVAVGGVLVATGVVVGAVRQVSAQVAEQGRELRALRNDLAMERTRVGERLARLESLTEGNRQ